MAFAPFHKLDGKGEAQNTGDHGELKDLSFFRLHGNAGIVFPDLVVGPFFPGQTQQRLLVFLALGKAGDFFIDDTFCQLVLLHFLHDGKGLGG